MAEAEHTAMNINRVCTFDLLSPGFSNMLLIPDKRNRAQNQQ